MSALSKAEYLKRYMSGPDVEDSKKKKRRKKAFSANQKTGLKLVDEDVDLQSLSTAAANAVDDEAPTIAEVIDERPEEVRRMEEYTTSDKWKSLGKDEENTFQKKSLVSSKQRTGDSSSHGGARLTHDSDNSPPRRHDSDNSPRRRRHDSDNSPPRRRHDSDDSPPRRRHDSDDSPPRRRHDSAQKPPRRKQPELDASPPRRRRHDSDESPPRRTKDSSKDLSPPRRRGRSSESDLSPERKNGNNENDSDLSPPRKQKTLSGKMAGLSSAKDMKLEAEKLRKKEAEMFSKIGEDLMGKNAATVFRDRATGKKRDLYAEKQASDEKKAAWEQKYKEWNKGLAQGKAVEARAAEVAHEMNKPIAREKDDADLESYLKDQDREGDPMLEFMKKKKAAKSKAPKYPEYRGPAPPPNRFGLRPGYRWDGVDRSNGFEKKLFESMSNKVAVKSQAYKWSTEDM